MTFLTLSGPMDGLQKLLQCWSLNPSTVDMQVPVPEWAAPVFGTTVNIDLNAHMHHVSLLCRRRDVPGQNALGSKNRCDDDDDEDDAEQSDTDTDTEAMPSPGGHCNSPPTFVMRAMSRRGKKTRTPPVAVVRSKQSRALEGVYKPQQQRRSAVTTPLTADKTPYKAAKRARDEDPTTAGEEDESPLLKRSRKEKEIVQFDDLPLLIQDDVRRAINYFNEHPNIFDDKVKEVVRVKKGEKESLSPTMRTFEHLLTHHCHCVTPPIMLGGGASGGRARPMYRAYKEKLQQVGGKKHCDPFGRGNLLLFRDAKITDKQLVFYHWASETGILDYAYEHTEEINTTMPRNRSDDD